MQKKFILIFIACLEIDRQLLHDEVVKGEIGSGKFIISVHCFLCFDIRLPSHPPFL